MKALFHERGELSAFLRGRTDEALRAVDGFPEESLLGTGEHDLVDHFYGEFALDPPRLRLDDMVIDSQGPRQVDARGLPGRYVRDPGRPLFIAIDHVTVACPIDGNPGLMDYKPSSYSLNLPRAQIRGGELVVDETMDGKNDEQIGSAIRGRLAEIQRWCDRTSKDVEKFNVALRDRLQAKVKERKAAILKRRGLVAALGIPLRRRADAAETYAVPVRRKALKFATSSVSKPFAPEPTIETAVYEEIIILLLDALKMMERSPSAFSTMKEEHIRDHLLFVLNGHFYGGATGETFNRSGKTDILIRHDNRNLFVGECKVWSGPKNFVSALEQLLSYTTWRDTKTALLIFNRGKSATDVAQKADAAMSTCRQFKRRFAFSSPRLKEVGLQGYVVSHPEDVNREIFVSVLVLHTPASVPSELVEPS